MSERRIASAGRALRPRADPARGPIPSTHPNSPGSWSVSRDSRGAIDDDGVFVAASFEAPSRSRIPTDPVITRGSPNSRWDGAIRAVHRPETRIRRRLDSPGGASHDALSPALTGRADRVKLPAPFGRDSRATRDIGPIGPPTPGGRRSRAPSRGAWGRMMGLEDRDGCSHPARDPAGRGRPLKDLCRDTWRSAMLAPRRASAE
jgi:hypothetical protein